MKLVPYLRIAHPYLVLDPRYSSDGLTARDDRVINCLLQRHEYHAKRDVRKELIYNVGVEY